MLITIKNCVNIKNDGDKCFKWCHIAILHPVKNNKYRLTNYTKYENKVNYTGIKFPVTINQIKNRDFK